MPPDRSRAGGGAPSHCAAATNACCPPTTGPRTRSASRAAANSTCTSAWRAVGTPASSSRARSSSRVRGPSATASITTCTPRAACASSTPSWRNRRSFEVRSCGVAERVQPPVVVGAHEVQGASLQPAHDERAAVGEGGVDVRGGEPGAAAAHREPEAARVLALDGEQPGDDVFGGRGRGPGQPLRREAGSGGTGPHAARAARQRRLPPRPAACGCSTSTTCSPSPSAGPAACSSRHAWSRLRVAGLRGLGSAASGGGSSSAAASLSGVLTVCSARLLSRRGLALGRRARRRRPGARRRPARCPRASRASAGRW